MTKDERRIYREKIRRARIYGHAHGLSTWPGGYVRDRYRWRICQGWIQLWDMRRERIEQWEQEEDVEVSE